MGRTLRWALAVGAGLAAYALWRAWSEAQAAPGLEDERVTEASEESFPASDAPSYTPMVGPIATDE